MKFLGRSINKKIIAGNTIEFGCYVATLQDCFLLHFLPFHSLMNAKAEMTLGIISKDQKSTHKSRHFLEEGKQENMELQVHDVMSAKKKDVTFHFSVPSYRVATSHLLLILLLAKIILPSKS